jgi:hypothetical protein
VAKRVLELVSNLTEDDRVIFLLSGGGSALLALPAEGITLADKQSINKALLKSGATIGEMNCVRKHLSAIKGGAWQGLLAGHGLYLCDFRCTGRPRHGHRPAPPWPTRALRPKPWRFSSATPSKSRRPCALAAKPGIGDGQTRRSAWPAVISS